MPVTERMITFGRAPDDLRLPVPHVCIDDPYTSRKHCLIVERDGGRYFVSDMGSTSGTQLVSPEGVPVRVLAPAEILPGWLVKIGGTFLPYRVDKLAYLRAVLLRRRSD